MVLLKGSLFSNSFQVWNTGNTMKNCGFKNHELLTRKSDLDNLGVLIQIHVCEIRMKASVVK